MKKVAVLVLLMSLIFTMVPVMASAASKTVETKLYLDGKMMDSKVKPMIVNNKTLVPLRIIAEGLGSQVDWNGKKKTVTVSKQSKTIQLTVNQKKAAVNGKSFVLEQPPMEVKGNTYIPLRFVGEQLGALVSWDGPTKSVFVYKPAEESKPPVSEGSKPDSGSSSGGNGGSTPADNGSGSSSGDGTGTVQPGDGSAGTTPPAAGEGNGTEQPTDPASDPMKRIQSIVFDQGRITIQGDGPIKTDKPFMLTNPDRLVVDLPYSKFADIFNGASIADPKVKQAGEVSVTGDTYVNKIRYSLYTDTPSTIRVVVDLKSNSSYSVEANDSSNQLIITTDPALVTVPVPDPSTDPTTDPSTNPPTDPSTDPATDPNANHKYKIVIDAGHGGKDPGAPTITKKWEKNFNLAVATKINELLSQVPNVEVIMTRSDDTFYELDERVKIANDAKADLFISIHGNVSASAAVRGTETYYSRPESKPFADFIHQYIMQGTGLPNRNVKQANFRVIKNTTMPAILIESGFLSNSIDEAAMFKEDFQYNMANSIVSGLKAYLEIK